MTPPRSIPSLPGSTVHLGAALVAAALAVAGCGSGSSHSTSRSPQTSSISAGSSASSSSPGDAGTTTFSSRPFASGIALQISTPKGKVSITQPDDITNVGSDIFVGFQNGVGPQGEPTPAGSPGTGNRDSTIVEFSSSGAPLSRWNVLGHVDGVTADPSTGQVIVTTNEDANPHLYAITPGSSQAATYQVPKHLPSNGGLDAISFYDGMMLVSASAPGTVGKAPPQASYPAVYVVHLDPSTHTATFHGLFGDEATAKRANTGMSGNMRLALTDPDSNFAVPAYAQRFGGDFALTSQGDYLQIFSAGPSASKLSALKLSQSIDDSAWSPGPSSTLYVTDGSADLIYKITGPFQKGSEVVGVTPCDAGNAPSSCPAPGFPSNYLGMVNQSTGAVSKFPLHASIQPAGLLFMP